MLLSIIVRRFSPSLRPRPKGIDVFERRRRSVAGGGHCSTILRAFSVWPHRAVQRSEPVPGPDMISVLRKRLLVRGFIVWDFPD